MAKSKLLSIIIPVYNAEKFITRCLDSIFNQISDDCEVILIDDGCSDASGAICDQFEEINPGQCQVLHQLNQGASSARNKGLERAKGSFIWFVDADDYVHPGSFDAIRTFLISHPECEILNVDYEQSGVRKCDNFVSSPTSGIDFIRSNSRLYLWNHIYNIETIGTIRFLDGTKNIEDWLFNLEVLVSVKEIQYLPILGYHYQDDNQNSTSRHRSRENLKKLSQDSLAVHQHLLAFSQTLADNEKISVINDALNFSILGHLYSLYKFYNPNDLLKVINEYSSLGIYPTMKTNNRKANLFRVVANHKWFLYVSCGIRRLGTETISRLLNFLK